MSAHDVAIAAHSEVASNARAESQLAETTSSAIDTDNSIHDGLYQRESLSQGGNSLKIPKVLTNSSNDSQTTTADASTPPTSEEFPQSQESQPQLEEVSRLDAVQPLSQSSQIDGLYSPQVLATNAGQKRTRDGLTKTSSPERPSTGHSGGHSRIVSSASIVSSTASTRELTSELRTRLSYAMVKVSKGWESLPIDEVESLASQLGSPTSSNSTLHGRKPLLTSPRAAIASMQGLSHGSPSKNLGASSSTIDPVLYGDPRPSRTYESFWREQTHKKPAPSGSAYPHTGHHTLAPAPDIVSASRSEAHPRRSDPAKYARPSVLQSASNLSQSSNSSDVQSAPLTPNRGHPTDAVLQTPTQKSIQEQDAIETLLFMSSPGHSSLGQAFPQSQGHTSQAQSPLRTEFGGLLRGAHGRKVEYPDAGKVLSDSPDPARRRRPLTGVGRLRDDEFDKMLDNMPDDDSTDDEIELPITPNRFAASRV